MRACAFACTSSLAAGRPHFRMTALDTSLSRQQRLCILFDALELGRRGLLGACESVTKFVTVHSSICCYLTRRWDFQNPWKPQLVIVYLGRCAALLHKALFCALFPLLLDENVAPVSKSLFPLLLDEMQHLVSTPTVCPGPPSHRPRNAFHCLAATTGSCPRSPQRRTSAPSTRRPSSSSGIAGRTPKFFASPWRPRCDARDFFWARARQGYRRQTTARRWGLSTLHFVMTDRLHPFLLAFALLLILSRLHS